MDPAYKRFHARNLSRLKTYLWLVMQHQFVPLHSEAKVGFDRLPLDGSDVHLLRIELIVVAAFFLGLIHGCVRIPIRVSASLPSSGYVLRPILTVICRLVSSTVYAELSAANIFLAAIL